MSYVPLRWDRFSVGKDRREWTPRRIAAAKRAVEREKEKVALFPELARYENVYERMADMDARSEAFSARMRWHRARRWREARRRLRWLTPHLREGYVELWNGSRCPGDPSYLLDMIYKTANPWAKLAELCELKLHGLRVKAAVAEGKPAPKWPFGDPEKNDRGGV